MEVARLPLARLLWVVAGFAVLATVLAQPAGNVPVWRGVPGEAQAISVARDGFTVAAGRDGRLWGCRGPDSGWSPLPGEGVRLASLGGGRFFAIRKDGELTLFDGLKIELAGLHALDIAADGSGAAYAIRADHQLVRRSPAQANWELLGETAARRLALAPDKSVWLALADGGIARWSEGKLASMPGSAVELAVGADGTVLAIDRDGALRRWQPSSRTWQLEPAPARMASIALGPPGVAWGAIENGAVVARVPPAPVAPLVADITFGKRTVPPGYSANRVLRRSAFVAIDPAYAITDPSPIVWIDTLSNAASLAIAGRDGSIFALDAAGNIGRWSNQQRRFLPFPGVFAKIAVEADGNPWGVNSLGRIFRHDASLWHQINGTASDISIGVSGRTMASTAAGALLQYLPTIDSLAPLAGLVFSVVVAPDGTPWGLLQDGTVVHCPSFPCQRFTRTARSLAIGPDGSVFIVTLDNLLERLQATQEDWDVIQVLGKKLVSVAVGPKGRPWVIADDGHVYASAFFPRDESTDLLEASITSNQTVGSGSIAAVEANINSAGIVFSKNLLFQSILVPAGTDGLSIGPGGTVLVLIGTNALARFDSSRNAFAGVTGFPAGNISHATVGPDGTLWILSGDVDGLIYHQLSGSNYEALRLPIANPQTAQGQCQGQGQGQCQGQVLLNRVISIAPDGGVYAIDTVGTLYSRPAGATRFSKLIAGIYLNVAIPRVNDVWVIDGNGIVREIVDGAAQPRPPNRRTSALDIAGGRDGTVYIATQIGGVDRPAKWNANSQTWDQVSQVADTVAVAPDGRPWLFSSASPTRVLRAK